MRNIVAESVLVIGMVVGYVISGYAQYYPPPYCPESHDSWWTLSCDVFSFQPTESQSEKTLRSSQVTETCGLKWERDWERVPCGHDRKGRPIWCHEPVLRPRCGCDRWYGPSHSQLVKITVDRSRPPLPWEKESFKVCLKGYDVSAHPVDASYDKYDVQEQDGHILFIPTGKKIPMNPDPEGLSATLLAPMGKLDLTIEDKWIAYYATDQTIIKVNLWEDIPFWFDNQLLVDKEIGLKAGITPQTIDLIHYLNEENQKLNPENKKELQCGSKYYVIWSFKRVGSISKDTEIDKDETDRALYQSPICPKPEPNPTPEPPDDRGD